MLFSKRSHFNANKRFLSMYNFRFTLEASDFRLKKIVPYQHFIKAILFFGLLCTTFNVRSQNAEKLSDLNVKQPIEKIHMHLDRTIFHAGETIWFKAYLFADFKPDTISTDLYIEFINDSSRILSKLKLPVVMGFSYGNIEIPDSIAKGNYMIRAYTQNMFTHYPEFLYHRNVFVFSTINPPLSVSTDITRSTHVDFFPEGGNLVNGLPNLIAFKAVNEKGLPKNVAGFLRNNSGDTVTQFASTHDGMGMFGVLPDINDQLTAVIEGKEFMLPKASQTGVVLKMRKRDKNRQFEILQQTGDETFMAATVIGQIQHQVIFKSVLTSKAQRITGMIPTEDLPSGIMQVTVFNKDNQPLAERLVFIDNNEYKIQSDLKTDTLQKSPRQKNVFHLQLKDVVDGNFSVSVVDAEYDAQGSEDIFSNLLLTSDLKGYIHNPSFYFSGRDTMNAIDLVMMTNGWRKFSWTALLQTPVTVKKQPENKFIVLKGTATYQHNTKPVESKELLVHITTHDFRNIFQLVKTDNKGKFEIDSLIFYGQVQMYFQENVKKNRTPITVQLENAITTSTMKVEMPLHLRRMRSDTTDFGNLVNDYEIFSKEKGIVMEAVVVTSKKKTPLQELEERYVSTFFNTNATRTLDLLHDSAATGLTIFDYMDGRVPGITVERQDGAIVVYHRNRPTGLFGRIPMQIFLDEFETDASIVENIPLDKIALVKVYDHFVGVAGNAPGGVLSIYTKKGKDLLTSEEGKRNRSFYSGYSITKQFFSPDYSVEQAQVPDRRKTLLWNPLIFVRGINAKIPIVFYNTDQTTKFKVVVEGMTSDGRLFSFQKVL